MIKIRKWLKKLRRRVTEERIPLKYRSYTPEQWMQEQARIREELQKLQETGSENLDEVLKFLEEHHDFLVAVDILKKRQMRKNLHDIKY